MSELGWLEFSLLQVGRRTVTVSIPWKKNFMNQFRRRSEPTGKPGPLDPAGKTSMRRACIKGS